MTLTLRYLRHSYRLRWLRRTMALMPLLLIGACVVDKDTTDRLRWAFYSSNECSLVGGPLSDATAHGKGILAD